MNDATDLIAYELRRNRTSTAADLESRHRSALATSRRRARRQRLADRVRSVADRLEA